MSHEPSTSAGPRLLGPAEVRSLADAIGPRPTKQRGQTFVIDPNTVRRIVRAAGVGADAIASRLLTAVAGPTRFLESSNPGASDADTDAVTDHRYASVHVDDTIIELHRHAKHGAGFGHSEVPDPRAGDRRQRLRKGACGHTRSRAEVAESPKSPTPRSLPPRSPSR